MTLPSLSPNTQAILLLTAPLIAGNGTSSSSLLSHNEYRKLARRLHEMQLQPANLLDLNTVDLQSICQGIVEESRVRRLLERGFLLSQVIERWQARAIWVISRADASYRRISSASSDVMGTKRSLPFFSFARTARSPFAIPHVRPTEPANLGRAHCLVPSCGEVVYSDLPSPLSMRGFFFSRGSSAYCCRSVPSMRYVESGLQAISTTVCL
jgi:hypothetical protein